MAVDAPRPKPIGAGLASAAVRKILARDPQISTGEILRLDTGIDSERAIVRGAQAGALKIAEKLTEVGDLLGLRNSLLAAWSV